MAVPACCRIWVRVSSAVSLAKSVSLMRLREADRFSVEVCRLATTEVKRFWIAPKSARVLLIEPSASSTRDSAFCAPVVVLTSRSMACSLAVVTVPVAMAAPGAGQVPSAAFTDVVSATVPATVASTPAVRSPPFLTWVSFTVAPSSLTSARMPVSPSLALMAVAAALFCSATLAPLATSMLSSLMALTVPSAPFTEMVPPMRVASAVAPPGGVRLALLKLEPPSLATVASTVLSMAIA